MIAGSFGTIAVTKLVLKKYCRFSSIQKIFFMTIHELNTLPVEELKEALFKCCGSTTWVNKMVALLPMEELVELMDFAEEQWYACSEADWREAFSHHPKIGDVKSLEEKFSEKINGWES